MSVSDRTARRRLKREVAQGSRVIAAVPGRPLRTSGTFLKRGPTRELVALAWPIAAAMLGETAIGLVDTKLVGGLGAAALGGVGMASTLMFLGYAIVFGLMRGVKVRTAHAIGSGRPLDGLMYARSGLVMGFALGLVIMVLSRDASPLLIWLGTDPDIVPYARDFLAAVTLGAPATCALAALIQHRQAAGDSRTPMVVGITGNVFNAAVGWALIYGHAGLPALGVRGAGCATALTEALELLTMVVLLVRFDRASRARASAAEGPQMATIAFGKATRDVATLGVPTAVQFGTETLAFFMLTAVIGGLGKDEIAGHQIALNLLRVSFLPGVAVGEAASVLVGQSLGRGSIDEADAVVKRALVITVAFMATCGLGFALGGGYVARFFSTDHAVVTVARRLLVIAAVFQVLDGVSIVLRGALRGAKDVRVSALIGVTSIWLCVPTGAYFLGKLGGLGALGGWIGFIGETTIAAVLFWARWRRGAWRKSYAP